MMNSHQQWIVLIKSRKKGPQSTRFGLKVVPLNHVNTLYRSRFSRGNPGSGWWSKKGAACLKGPLRWFWFRCLHEIAKFRNKIKWSIWFSCGTCVSKIGFGNSCFVHWNLADSSKFVTWGDWTFRIYMKLTNT